ncbi:MAG: hypothetical protein IT303_10975 [Dehalococcoidia bacterium]|nr:hypothetical protein [Dehalococcoidia bacterium]
MEFFGYQEYSMDDRNRVPIPPGYREAFGMKAMLVPGADRVVEIYTEEGWAKRAEPLQRLSMTNRDARRRVRAFYANSTPIAPDTQGRLTLPQRFVDYAGIEGDRKVVVLGNRTHLEVWAKSAWDAENEELEGSGFGLLDDPSVFEVPETTGEEG